MIPASVQYATATLTIPPSAASSTDSVRTCAMSWRRVAPSESRTAISVVRFAARASSRLRDVGAGDEQHDACDREEQRQRAFVTSVIAELWPLRPSVSVMTAAAESCRGRRRSGPLHPRRLDVGDDRVIHGVDRRARLLDRWRPARGDRTVDPVLVASGFDALPSVDHETGHADRDEHVRPQRRGWCR